MRKTMDFLKKPTLRKMTIMNLNTDMITELNRVKGMGPGGDLQTKSEGKYCASNICQFDGVAALQ